MSKSRIRGLTPTLPDGYTSEPTHLRIYRDDCNDPWPWHLDAADEHGNYTEVVGRFTTHEQAVATMPQFIDEVTACYSPRWRWLSHSVTSPPDDWCGYSAPFLGRCSCGDPANHEPGGRFYKEGRLPDQKPTGHHHEAWQILGGGDDPHWCGACGERVTGERLNPAGASADEEPLP